MDAALMSHHLADIKEGGQKQPGVDKLGWKNFHRPVTFALMEAVETAVAQHGPPQ